MGGWRIIIYEDLPLRRSLHREPTFKTTIIAYTTVLMSHSDYQSGCTILPHGPITPISDMWAFINTALTGYKQPLMNYMISVRSQCLRQQIHKTNPT